MSLPELSPASIRSYNQLMRDMAAFNYVLRIAKPSGAYTTQTLATLNGLFHRANRLFRRHRDLPYFFSLSIDEPMSHADVAIIVTRLTAACLAFEERYEHLTEEGRERAARAERVARL